MKKLIIIGTLCAVFAGLLFVGYPVAKEVRKFIVEDSIHGSYFPVVIALFKATEENKAAPKELDELMPDFLPLLPSDVHVDRVEYSSEGENWELTLYSDSIDGNRTYRARQPNFTKEEIESSLLYYHATWLVNKANQAGDDNSE